ncbi:DUF1622 domain-containing protein [Paractinoplanes toevensis]|uniref:Membrane protein n=1 Tax=Paractinoplanes toevensis TaxID=571911 RepID=A0A919T636_9ACTN|nr:DUF1622 domain-containing protein [Actinoplanes toevensis]GIM88681.1 membrane protein [Actinoplanes toevensis]
MHSYEGMEWVVTGFEVAGVAILAIGSLLALGSAAATLRHSDPRTAYKRARQDVGRVILLGLEVLIIADIVLTITVDRTLESALTLGLIVLVRTFLSFSLEIELEGSLPWRRDPAGSKPAETIETRPAGEAADVEGR